MTAIIISALAVSYCCVFFLKKTKHKIAVLFAVDSLVLAAMFIVGAAARETAVFIISAAAVNVTVFFIPVQEAFAPFSLKDFAAITANAGIAVLAAVFLIQHPVQAQIHPEAVGPLAAAFLFMALFVSGFFIVSSRTGEEK